MALDVGGLVGVPVVVAHVAPVDTAQGHDLAGAEDLALSGHARTTTRDLAAASVDDGAVHLRQRIGPRRPGAGPGCQRLPSSGSRSSRPSAPPTRPTTHLSWGTSGDGCGPCSHLARCGRPAPTVATDPNGGLAWLRVERPASFAR
jgi:hypothetical protein